MPGPLKRRRNRPSKIPAGWVHPPCPICEDPVERREGESPHTWFHRVCCSTSCGASMGSREAAAASHARFAEAEGVHPPCFHCRGAVLRRPHESIGRYQVRATCPLPDCRTAYRSHVMAVDAARRKEEREAGHAPSKRDVMPAEVATRETVPIDFAGGFARHNLAFKPMLGRVLYAPPTRTYGGVSSVYISVGGGSG